MHRSRLISGAILGALILSVAVPVAAFGISRDTVMSRGKVWVDKNVPYSQTRYATVAGSLVPTTGLTATQQSQRGYRTDCSGFVSMALGIERNGYPASYTTSTFRSVLTTISKEMLLPGDVILKPGTHAVVFARWADTTHTYYWTYEESGSNKGTISRKVPYPFFGTGYRPYRYNSIAEYYSDVIDHVYGMDYYETASASSRAAFPSTSTATAPALVVANGKAWSGNLSAAGLAGAAGGPLLLARDGSLPTTAAAVIRRLKPATVYVIGGSSVVPTEVVTRIASLGPKVERITGRDRYLLAEHAAAKTVALAKARKRSVTTAYLVNSDAFANGVIAAGLAGKTWGPILLTGKLTVPSATLDALKANGIKRVVAVGSEASIDPSVLRGLVKRGYSTRRIAGDDVGELSANAADYGVATGALGWKGLGVASSTSVEGGLAYAVNQAQAGSVLLLTPSSSLHSDVAWTITDERAKIGKVRVFGSYWVLPRDVRRSIAGIMRAQ